MRWSFSLVVAAVASVACGATSGTVNDTAPAVASASAGQREGVCSFPIEADRAGVAQGYAVLHVAVGADGRPTSIEVVADSGFGEAARACAETKMYIPARSADGRLIAGDVTFLVRFVHPQ